MCVCSNVVRELCLCADIDECDNGTLGVNGVCVQILTSVTMVHSDAVVLLTKPLLVTITQVTSPVTANKDTISTLRLVLVR